MSRKKFAFIVHARASIARDVGQIFQPLKKIPDRFYEWGLGKLQLPAVDWSRAYLKDEPSEPFGFILMMPLSARQMLAMPRHEMVYRIEKAVEQARGMGAQVIGLGALTSPLTDGGQALTHRRDVAVTNGNAYTAAIMHASLQRMLQVAGGPEAEVSVVGASGSVGSCVVELACRLGTARNLKLVARRPGPLQAMAEKIRQTAPNVKVQVATELSALKSSDVVVLLTAAADSLLKGEHLKQGAQVLDGTQPRNSDRSLMFERPDVKIVDGGWVSIPGIELTVLTEDWPRGCSFACLAETMLLALDGQEQHFTIGNATADKALHLVELAKKYSRYGFGLAPFHSFGEPLPMDWFDAQQVRRDAA